MGVGVGDQGARMAGHPSVPGLRASWDASLQSASQGGPRHAETVARLGREVAYAKQRIRTQKDKGSNDPAQWGHEFTKCLSHTSARLLGSSQ